MPYQLTQHAKDAIAKRSIPTAWLERVLASPQRIEVDGTDPSLEHRLAVIEEHGQRVLRVVVNVRTAPERVVTLFFDRNMKGKL